MKATSWSDQGQAVVKECEKRNENKKKNKKLRKE